MNDTYAHSDILCLRHRQAQLHPDRIIVKTQLQVQPLLVLQTNHAYVCTNVNCNAYVIDNKKAGDEAEEVEQVGEAPEVRV